MSYKDDDAEKDLTIQRMCVAHTCDGDNNYKEGSEQEAKSLQQKIEEEHLLWMSWLQEWIETDQLLYLYQHWLTYINSALHWYLVAQLISTLVLNRLREHP